MSRLTALSNVAHSDHPELMRVLSRILDTRFRFLVTEGDYITGQIIAVDGGRSIVP